MTPANDAARSWPDGQQQPTLLRQAARALGLRGLTEIVADVYGVVPSAVRGRDRRTRAREARQALYLILHQVCGWPIGYIAAAMHRNHSTVAHGIARARARASQSEGQVLLAATFEGYYVFGSQGMRPPQVYLHTA
jgi:hypothetical protein